MIIPKLIDYLSDNLEVFVGLEAPEQTTGYVLNRTVQDVMLSFVEEPEVSSVKLETDYNFTNTATKQYRWQAVYQITHYLGGN